MLFALFYCQALVHLLRTEGVQLNDKPVPPEDKSKRPKGYVAKKPEEDPDWIEYWYALSFAINHMRVKASGLATNYMSVKASVLVANYMNAKAT